MSLQYISDGEGKVLGVFIPIDEWDELKSKPEVKEALVKIEMEARAIESEKAIENNQTMSFEEFSRKSKDWWDEISDEEKAEIKEGIAQADSGETISHEEVMAKYKKWL